MNTISFYTFGCRLNQGETAVIQNTFDAGGYRVVKFEEPADIVVINTCTVTENGDTETRRLIQKITRLNPAAKIALVGCQAQVQKEQLAHYPNVKWIVGNMKKFDLVSIIGEMEDPPEARVITPTIDRENFTLPVTGIDRNHTRANLKIQDGCDFFCSFCEIPYARGRARSRVFDDILLEARALTAAGHQELILTGINVGTYRHGEKEFLHVLDALLKLDEVKRIRISSIEPTTIPMELFDRMGRDSKLCRYLHIPIQSGSDKILSLMKRKYTSTEFTDFVRTVSRKVPEICIGTDVIVGFPGEGEAEFQQTEQLLRELPLAYFHVFSYSERRMAKSQHLPEKISASIIQHRSQLLRALSQRKRRLFHESLIGTTQRALFEHKKDDFWLGFTDNYVRIRLQSAQALHNTLKDVKLIHAETFGAEAIEHH